jgi:N-acetylglutamate synthase-like GNAT family acetyltransferase
MHALEQASAALTESLLDVTLAEARQQKASCYLETFTPRNLNFYERLGFRRVAAHLEPVTNREYVVMQRDAEKNKAYRKL